MLLAMLARRWLDYYDLHTPIVVLLRWAATLVAEAGQASQKFGEAEPPVCGPSCPPWACEARQHRPGRTSQQQLSLSSASVLPWESAWIRR